MHVASAVSVALITLSACAHAPTLVHRGSPTSALGLRQPAVTFGVMGSAAASRKMVPKLQALGAAIAAAKGVVLTGGFKGLPHEVAKAARRAGGHAVAVSAAASLEQHRQLGLPVSPFEAIYLSGTGPNMGFIAQEQFNIGFSDIVVFVGGRSGTLGELMFACAANRPIIALLEGTGGVTDGARRTILPITGCGKNTVILADTDPGRLIRRALDAYRKAPRPQVPLPTTTNVPYPTDTRLRIAVDIPPARDQAWDQARETLTHLAKSHPNLQLVVPRRPGTAQMLGRVGYPARVIEPEGAGAARLASYRHVAGQTQVTLVVDGDYLTLGGVIFALYRPGIVAVLERSGLGTALRSILALYDKPAVAKLLYADSPHQLAQRVSCQLGPTPLPSRHHEGHRASTTKAHAPVGQRRDHSAKTRRQHQRLPSCD